MHVRMPFLYIGITLAILSVSGKVPVLSDKLNKYNRGCSITGAISYINFGAIPSGPGDLFVYSSFQ